jgi:hypothetical protein
LHYRVAPCGTKLSPDWCKSLTSRQRALPGQSVACKRESPRPDSWLTCCTIRCRRRPPSHSLLRWRLPKGLQEIGPRLTVSSFANAARAPSWQFYFSEAEKEVDCLWDFSTDRHSDLPRRYAGTSIFFRWQRVVSPVSRTRRAVRLTEAKKNVTGAILLPQNALFRLPS